MTPPTALRDRPARANGAGPPPLALRDDERDGAPREVSLDDKYRLEDGRILLTGVQALVRLPLDQNRADRRRGLRTATMVSGYQGSPLGALDKELQRNGALCREHDVVHVPALNEELGATAAWGSQLAARLPKARYDGVIGMWYGKAPGLDRAMDALRHGNFVGVGRTGGGLAVVGDDPSCKSSTIPSASESALASMHMPVFFPGSVQEVLDLGLHALACSRASGLWSGFKIVTNVADAVGTADVAAARVVPVMPESDYEHVPSGNLLAPGSLEMERSLVGARTELALAYARANAVNRIEGARDAWLGIVTTGKPYYDVAQALSDLGLGERELERAGIRVLKLGMLWPLDQQVVRQFARGLSQVVVAEEKGPFVETAVRDALYGGPDQPLVVGKRDEQGRALLPVEGDLDADVVARVIAERLRARGVVVESVEARMRSLEEAARRPLALPMAARTPFFCSGCPHNSSVKAPEGTLVGGGIGCHTMVLLNPEGKGAITGITQMGGEGAQWIGMAPFTDERHLVQNLGDGTFSHSGSLAIRAAVAAGVNVTYKLLYNGHVAMTGGQDVAGQMSVPDLTRWLELEGVRRVVVTTEDVERYRGVSLSPIAEVRDRGELMATQRELATVDGVTVLIHDQECAAELRRGRKRGERPDPPERIWINERVCEGCGDCGKKSSCLSVVPVETEFGRKTQIHQASCNKDYSCVEGDCPSFLTVVPGKKAKPSIVQPPVDLVEPSLVVPRDDWVVRMMGIGGTGVVTVNQVLGVAALMDGFEVSGLDQTGLSQKGGPVVSDLRVSRRALRASSKLPAGSADLYLGFDLLGAASPKNLVTAAPERTVAVVSTHAVATGRMVVDPGERFPELDAQLSEIERVTRGPLNVWLDAQELSERLFGDHMPANLVALGAAYQRGTVPVSAASIERAIELNGAAVEKNLAAFRWGRALVIDPDAIEAATRAPEAPRPELELSDDATELDRLLAIRVPELVAYQDERYAERYLSFVELVREADSGTAITEAVARNLYKLMAYKDEYEVARLHLDSFEQARLRGELGDDAKVWFMLHPPLLRALGLKRKLKLGRWFVPVLRMLRAMRRLRGHWYDPFGHTRIRRLERELVREYEELVTAALGSLSPGTYETVVELAELPDVIRGYEEIKLAGVERFRERADELLAELRGAPRAASPVAG